jgi:3-phosphoshikimate 1-carboxyvinyltransferase
MKYVISGPENPLQDTIYLPSSKSISNRMLVMHALAGGGPEPANLSDSDDTRCLRLALESSHPVRDIGHAGTAMRFLTAYFALKRERVVLTGSQRMKERPVGPLVSALRELGASIRYLEKEGCPPLEITGGLEKGGSIQVDGGISSQFISALMMVGPRLQGGLHISLGGEVVSSTYIRMTLALMQRGGIKASFNGGKIRISEGTYHFGLFEVESDWSGASYWYEVAALFPGSVITLPNLEKKSLQGDAVLPGLFKPLGVSSHFRHNTLTIRSDGLVCSATYLADLTGSPDLVQTLAATLCAMGVPFRLTGTRTLRIKETDRIAALKKELGKLGFRIESGPNGDWIGWDGNRGGPLPDPVIETYHDHRMAMAFAPLAIAFGKVSISDPNVVSKSYPGFWADLKKTGFRVSVP